MRLRSLQNKHKRHFKPPGRELTMDDSLAGLYSEADDVHALGAGGVTGAKGSHPRSLSVFDASLNKGVRVVRKLRQMSNAAAAPPGKLTMGPGMHFSKPPRSI